MRNCHMEAFYFQSGNLSASIWKDKRYIHIDFGVGYEMANRKRTMINKPQPSSISQILRE